MEKGKITFLIVSCIIFLLVIQLLFSIPAPVKCLEAVWGAGDLISFVGTITLGIVAIKQTKDANDMNKRLMQLEENRYKLEMRPFVIVSDWTMLRQKIDTIYFFPDQLYINVCAIEKAQMVTCISFVLTNTTKSYVSVTYKGAQYLDSEEKLEWGLSYSNTTNKSIQMKPGESKKIAFYGEKEKLISSLRHKRIRFSFWLENRFGEKYQEDIDCTLIVMQWEDRVPEVIIDFFNYHIGKFVKGSDGKPIVNWEDEINA